MKRIYYPAGPPRITAGAAGLFFVGKAKPVSDKLAAQLLKRPDFKQAPDNIPNMDGYEQLLAEAEAADAADQPKPEKKAAKGGEEAKQ